jgi:hypothetical protein
VGAAFACDVAIDFGSAEISDGVEISVGDPEGMAQGKIRSPCRSIICLAFETVKAIASSLL